MGFKKTLLCIGGLMLATGGPITLFSTSDFVAGIKRTWQASPVAAAFATSQPAGSPQQSTPTAITGPAHLVPVSMTPADATPTPGLEEVLRFAVTVEWVMHRWPRVSTGLPQVQLQGYRVPLVTGTTAADVAGSLTYYFNAQQQVQRITLRGATGDPGRLVTLLSGRHHFARRLTNDPGLVLYETVDSSNHPAGSLKIRSAGVVKASQPYSRFEVDLLLDRPE